MMDQEVVMAALAKEVQVVAVVVHIYVHYGRRLPWLRDEGRVRWKG